MSNKKDIVAQFPDLLSRIVQLNNHTLKSKFHRNYPFTYQKGRKVPFHLQPKIKNVFENFFNEGHIEKLSICLDQNLI